MDEVKRLKNLRTLEVSLVGTPANRRKFLLTKSMAEEGSDEMDDDMMTALREALALLSPYKEKGCGDLVMGMEKMAAGEEWPFMLKMTPTPGDVHVASTELEKGESGSQDSQIGKEENTQMDDKNTNKIDLTTLPPEVQAQIDQLFKSQEEAIRKAEELEKVLKEEKDKRLTEEALAFAKGLSNLSVDPEKIAPVVKTLREKAPEEMKAIEHLLVSADRAIGEGALFKELGTSVSANGASTWAKIENLASGLVQKGEGMTKEQAIDRVLKENPDMYNDYLKEIRQ